MSTRSACTSAGSRPAVILAVRAYGDLPAATAGPHVVLGHNYPDSQEMWRRGSATNRAAAAAGTEVALAIGMATLPRWWRTAAVDR